MPRHTPSWSQAVNEPGAVHNVLISAGIVILVATVILAVGMKWKFLQHVRKTTASQQAKIAAAICIVIFFTGYRQAGDRV